jgi:hypothetical protein
MLLGLNIAILLIRLQTFNVTNTGNPSAPTAARSDTEVYVQNLLPKRHGFPLWYPQPDESLPYEYRKDGVGIGDVGIITSHGYFDFLFNICRPSDHPINSNGVPQDFCPLEFPKAAEIFTAILQDTHIASRSIEKLTSSTVDESQAQPR